MAFEAIVPRIAGDSFAAVVLLPLLAYLCGSLPFAIWLTRLIKGVDVRDAGSGHATTTNTIRQAGFGAGVAVLLLDISKGFLPVYLAVQLGTPAWLTGLTCAAAVAGHCWPVFAQFRGGMGLATAGGGYLAVSPLSFAIILALLIALTLLIRHSARASVLTGLTAAPVLLVFDPGPAALWLAFLSGLILATRFAIDWRREYRELWLDRDPQG